jgi:opacity protein-like surface antigen
MFNLGRKTFLAGILAVCAAPAFAADMPEPPPVIEQPPVYEAPAPEYGGWYIRGDIDYHKPSWRGADYITYGPGTDDFTSGKLKGAFSLGAGVGYQINDHFRADLTADYWFKSKFSGHTDGTCGGGACTSNDSSGMSAWLLLANAYVDLGTWHGFTPYVGAGIGGAHIKWDTLHNADSNGGDFYHKGTKGWRFAYALMAGTSYCLTDRTKLDVGYRFTHINGGRMFEEYGTNGASIGVGPGFDKGFNVHEVRAGLRYSFGGPANGCAEPVQVVYEPQPEPIYTK